MTAPFLILSDCELDALETCGAHVAHCTRLYLKLKRRSCFKTHTVNYLTYRDVCDMLHIEYERGCNKPRQQISYRSARVIVDKLRDSGLVKNTNQNTFKGEAMRIFLPFASSRHYEERHRNGTGTADLERHEEVIHTTSDNSAHSVEQPLPERHRNGRPHHPEERHNISKSVNHDDVSGLVSFQNGQFKGITGALIESFKASYPLLDIPHQIQQIAAKAMRNGSEIKHPIPYLDKALEAKHIELSTTPPQQPGDDTNGQRYQYARARDIPKAEKRRRIAEMFGLTE